MADRLILGTFLPYRLATLSNRVSGAIATFYGERFDLTLPEWRVMAVLGEQPEMSATQVAEKTAMDKVAVSRAVSRLLDAGRLERHTSPEDKRRSVLALSSEGMRIYEEVVPLALAYEARLVAQLSPSQQRVLHEVLDKLDQLPESVLLEMDALEQAEG